MHGHRVMMIEDLSEAEKLLQEIRCDQGGLRLMLPKAVFRALKIRQVPARAALIIKQEMLARGGEAAISRGCLWEGETTDMLLLGTLRQYQLLAAKLKLQPFGLKNLAQELEQALAAYERKEYPIMITARGRRLDLNQRTLIMGILNVTPDSFSDGGRYLEPGRAVEHAGRMLEEGADIIDLGGVSTRPGSVPASQEEEMRRVLPALKALRSNYPEAVISLDTFRADTARAALEEGADIINDIWGLKADADMGKVAAAFNSPVVLMHNRGERQGGYDDLLSEMLDDLRDSLRLAEEAGIAEDRIIIDPGMGFAKNAEQNYLALKHLDQLKTLGKPILLGISRKSSIGKVLDLPVDERMEGSLAAAVIGVMKGAAIVRVHDVEATKRAIALADTVMRS